VTRYSLFLTLASIPSSPSTRQQRCGASAFYLLCGHLHQTSGRAATTLAQRSASFTFIHCTASVAPLCPPLAWLHNPGTCGSRCTCPFVAESPAGRAHSVRTTRISHVTRPPLSRPARCSVPVHHTNTPWYGCWERLQQLREERDLEVSSSAPATLVARYLLALTEADQSQHRTRCWSLFHPLTTSAQTDRNPSLARQHTLVMVLCTTCHGSPIDKSCTNTPRTCYQCCTSHADVLTCPFHSSGHRPGPPQRRRGGGRARCLGAAIGGE
jgi:hypothetical protein